ncbi:1032_t:CDS:2 [Cetraspora pellucida]|uniref:1032_t:CDS:1 n=1 Tax=Cetraspora pellucida TaxID=1433469 RepID=A0A9N9BR93_9GLOM|nr:1032_t:CDS:2 [Cetraspora pellucida]
MAIFTADEIEKVLINIGINKFGAVVSDGAFAISLAKQYISDKYLKILPVWCIANAEVLAKVLALAKNAVKIAESKVTTTADIFLFLIQIAIAINALKNNDLTECIEFHKQCIQFYNKHWKEFNIKFYLLAYFFHPKYCGKSIKSLVFQDILYTALEIWKKLGNGLASANILVAQIKMYDAFELPYNYTFIESIESSQTWDLEIEKMFNFNTFLEEKTNETTNSNVELEEDELDYDIDEVINISTSKV